MARRSPGGVRSTLRRRRSDEKKPIVPGVPGVAAAEIRRLDATRQWRWPVAQSLTTWGRYVRGPLRELAEQDGCPCCDPFESRRALEEALVVLSLRSQRALRAKIEPLDDIYRKRTGLDVFSESEWPGWDRRF
jgi:hypothetical protein